MLYREPGAGHWPEFRRKADGRMTGDHALLEVDGRLNKNGRRGGIEGEREDAGKLHWKARNLGESWRGDREGPSPYFEEMKRTNLNIKG